MRIRSKKDQKELLSGLGFTPYKAIKLVLFSMTFSALGLSAFVFYADYAHKSLAEECSELAVEASHSARIGTTVKIIEEMADVLIMMEQVIYLAGIDKCDIEDCINYKLDRQMKRIKEENNG